MPAARAVAASGTPTRSPRRTHDSQLLHLPFCRQRMIRWPFRPALRLYAPMVRGDEGFQSGGQRVQQRRPRPDSDRRVPGTWGSRSFIVETDIYQSLTRNRPGRQPHRNNAKRYADSWHQSRRVFLRHRDATACNGSLNLCVHSPIDTFEESPTPLTHNQRMEIITGCNSAAAPVHRDSCRSEHLREGVGLGRLYQLQRRRRRDQPCH